MLDEGGKYVQIREVAPDGPAGISDAENIEKFSGSGSSSIGAPDDSAA